MHAVTYLLKLQIDYVILVRPGQICLGMPKQAIKTLISKNWRYKVGFVHANSYLLKLQIDHVILDGHG